MTKTPEFTRDASPLQNVFGIQQSQKGVLCVASRSVAVDAVECDVLSRLQRSRDLCSHWAGPPDETLDPPLLSARYPLKLPVSASVYFQICSRRRLQLDQQVSVTRRGVRIMRNSFQPRHPENDPRNGGWSQGRLDGSRRQGWVYWSRFSRGFMNRYMRIHLFLPSTLPSHRP